MKPVQLQSERQFLAVLESVTRDVQQASFHWQLYRSLRTDVRRYLREFNEAPAFWSLTMGAHGDAALFRLVRLYEPDGGVSLERLIETIRANVHVFDVSRFRERLKENPHVDGLAKEARPPNAAELRRDMRSAVKDERLVAKLLTLRRRVLAHRDPRVILGTVPDPFSGLTARQISALLRRASRIVNRYWRLFNASAHSVRIMGHDDYRRVLEAMRDRRRTREREFREELRRVTGRRT